MTKTSSRRQLIKSAGMSAIGLGLVACAPSSPMLPTTSEGNVIKLSPAQVKVEQDLSDALRKKLQEVINGSDQKAKDELISDLVDHIAVQHYWPEGGGPELGTSPLQTILKSLLNELNVNIQGIGIDYSILPTDKITRMCKDGKGNPHYYQAPC